jgi:hypothetical protein
MSTDDQRPAEADGVQAVVTPSSNDLLEQNSPHTLG